MSAMIRPCWNMNMNCGRAIRMVNGNSSCCRPLQGNLDLHREIERPRERERERDWAIGFILQYLKCYGLQAFKKVA